MTDADLARRAADLIETHGWFQFRPTEHEQCLATAVSRVCQAHYGRPCEENGRAVERILRGVAELLGFEDPVIVVDIPDWNDAPGRTQDEVTTVLRQYAEKLEANQ